MPYEGTVGGGQGGSIPSMCGSSNVRIFRGFSGSALRGFRIHVQCTLMRASIRNSNFSTTSFFRFFYPINRRRTMFSYVFFSPLFTSGTFLGRNPCRSNSYKVNRIRIIFRCFLNSCFLFVYKRMNSSGYLTNNRPMFLRSKELFRRRPLVNLSRVVHRPRLVTFFRIIEIWVSLLFRKCRLSLFCGARVQLWEGWGNAQTRFAMGGMDGLHEGIATTLRFLLGRKRS